MTYEEELRNINHIALQRQLTSKEELRRTQLCGLIKPTKKSYNIDDVIKRVEKLETLVIEISEFTKTTTQCLQKIEKILINNGIWQ